MTNPISALTGDALLQKIHAYKFNGENIQGMIAITGPNAYIPLSRQQLDTIHPFFHALLVEMNDQLPGRVMKGHKHIMGTGVRATLLVWNREVATLQDRLGRNHLISYLFDVKRDLDNNVASLSIETMKTAWWTDPAGNTNNVFVSGFQKLDDIKVDIGVLDTQYPGWYDRFAIGKSMDMHPREHAAYMFSAVPEQPAVSLDNITFD